MRVYKPTMETTKAPVELDYGQPIIIFDEWPFRGHAIPVADVDHYFHCPTGELKLRGPSHSWKNSTLHEFDVPFIGVATDGLMVIGHSKDLP